jgi:hypothetical protein
MKISNYTIQQLNDRLENTVPTKQYVNAVKALKRCQELLGQAAAHVEDAEFKRELQVYAGSLDLFFDDLRQYPWAYMDITDGYNPVDHLRKLGVLPNEDNVKAALARDLDNISKDITKLRAKNKVNLAKKPKGGRK